MPAAVGETVWVAVRPEKLIELTTAAAAGGANRVRGTVSSIAYLGDLSIYHVRLPTGVTVRASAGTGTASPSGRSPGTTRSG